MDQPGRQHQQHHEDLQPYRSHRRDHPRLPGLRHQRRRHGTGIERGQRHHRHRRQHRPHLCERRSPGGWNIRQRDVQRGPRPRYGRPASGKRLRRDRRHFLSTCSIYPQDRPQKSLDSTLTRSEGMPMPESSRPSKRRADNADMTSRPTLANPRTAPPSATAGSQATSRPATSNGRSPSCNSSTPTLKSSPTLHPDSTTAERDLLPYWNDYTGAISSHLWLPTATDSPGSGPNSSSKSSSKTVANSWFSTSEISAPQRNSPRIYSPSLLSSLPEPTDSEGTGRKSRKIRIYPDRHQRAKLKLWSDASRFTYNRTIELLTSDGAPKSVLAENQEGYPHQAATVDQARPL